MHVAVYGAGALGSVYGVRLALHADTRITFVVRQKRVSETHPIVIEGIKKTNREAIDAPVRAAEVPANADVVLLCVGTEDLESIRGPLSTSAAPIVTLTPALPQDYERLRGAFGDRVIAALPNVVSYARKEDGVIRYWLAPMPMRIAEPKAGARAEPVRELARRLTAAGLETNFALGVHEANAASTMAFIPLMMGLCLAGSFDKLADDKALLDVARRACVEGVAISKSTGKAEPVLLASPYLATPFALHAIVAGLRRFSPEALYYAEEHFGRKLEAQHVAMAKDMVLLARGKGLPHDALDALDAKFAER